MKSMRYAALMIAAWAIPARDINSRLAVGFSIRARIMMLNATTNRSSLVFALPRSTVIGKQWGKRHSRRRGPEKYD